METKEIVIKAPGPDAPGYFKRQKAYARLAAKEKQLKATGAPDPELLAELVDQTIDFLAPYVTGVASLDEARALLEDASENEITAAFKSLAGAEKNS